MGLKITLCSPYLTLSSLHHSDSGGKKKSDIKQIEEDLFGDASDISSDEEGKRKLTIHDSDSDAGGKDAADEGKVKKKKAKVTFRFRFDLR